MGQMLSTIDHICHFFEAYILFPLLQIGPPNSQLIRSNDKSTWTAKDVADSVLSDKSALVIFLPLS